MQDIHFIFTVVYWHFYFGERSEYFIQPWMSLTCWLFEGQQSVERPHDSRTHCCPWLSQNIQSCLLSINKRIARWYFLTVVQKVEWLLCPFSIWWGVAGWWTVSNINLTKCTHELQGCSPVTFDPTGGQTVEYFPQGTKPDTTGKVVKTSDISWRWLRYYLRAAIIKWCSLLWFNFFVVCTFSKVKIWCFCVSSMIQNFSLFGLDPTK